MTSRGKGILRVMRRVSFLGKAAEPYRLRLLRTRGNARLRSQQCARSPLVVEGFGLFDVHGISRSHL
jgi:hypothetical protein